MPPRVVVVGDLLYDMLARVEGSVAFGTDTFTSIHASAGGSGANAAVWLASLGVETHFVGRVGDDVLGEALVGELKRSGVRPHLARDPSLATGKVFVLVNGAGERTMITDRGAGEALSPEDLSENLFHGGHLHLSGYILSGGSRRETALSALRLARDAGMSISVDSSSVPLLEEMGPGRFLEWTRGVDLCFPNLEEGALLGGAEDPDRVAQELLRYYPGVVLKLGAGGALYAGVDGEWVRLPAAPARVVDTTGAGDALCAGFLANRLSGAPPAGALQRGVELAARVVEQVGGRPKI
ncbi:MAG: sugar kinase [Actinomycetota bacterium]|nr:sugar kinase [Actinomycetota bacterium]